MEKEEEMQAEIARLKKYIIDINKNWQFTVERLDLSNKSLLTDVARLNKELVEKQEVIAILRADLAYYQCELCGAAISSLVRCLACERV